MKARVEIFGHDFDSSHVYSNLPVGNYHRYIDQGNYLFNFSCPGYQSKSFDVAINNSSTTILDVQLIPNSYVGIIQPISQKKLINEFDILGRKGSFNNIKIKVFKDGSTKKIFNINQN